MSGRNIFIGVVVILLVAGAFIMNADKKSASPPQTAEPEESNMTEMNEPVEQTMNDAQLQEGSTAKDFELKTLRGDSLQLSENNGKPTLINFWASWCPPCKEEMPHLQQAYETYGNKVNFFMVDLLFNDHLDNVKTYIDSNEFTFPVLLDETGDVLMDYQVVVIPTTFIVDENGVITHKVMGPMTMDRINTMMKEITS